jgi:hypothetical protein
MRKLAPIFIILSFFLFLSGLAFAQTRGEGVGTLFSNTQGDTTISINNVKTAPWSEVIVENGAGEIQAVAKLDEKGLVNFTFEAESTDVGLLSIYAVDEAGVTKKITIPGTSLIDEVLPPTLVSKEENELSENSVKLAGFSYPGATVSVNLTSDQGYDQTFSSIADATSGAWEIFIDALEGGSYTGSARADVSGETSQRSQEIYFEIATEGIVGQVVEQVGQVIEDLAAGTEEAIQGIIAAIQNLPESVKDFADTASKAAVPLSLLGIMLQAGLATGGDLLLLANQYLLILVRIPLFPLLLRRRRKKKPWGVLYDSFTKNPLSGGLVRLLSEAGNFIDMEITGNSGAFSFVPRAGKYKLEALKAGYAFPSQQVVGEKDGEYDHLYRGEAIEVFEDQPVVESSVPLDPKEIAEGAKIQRLFRKHGPAANMSILIGGLVLSGIAYLAVPAVYNQIVAGFYVVTLSLVTAGTVRTERTWGVVKDEAGNSVEAVALSLVEVASGRLVKRRLTNEQGRYQFVAPKGQYKVLIASFDWERADQRGCYDGSEIAVAEETEVINLPIAVKKKPITALKRRETI